jgi:L-alanine-DL-glutamate epimerase-like enolase superfamily enzyme
MIRHHLLRSPANTGTQKVIPAYVSRRDFLKASAALPWVGVLLAERLHAAVQDVKPVKITAIESFGVHVPVSREEAADGMITSYQVARVDTDAGVRGYSFAGPSPHLLDSRIRPALVGKDLFAIERHLKNGLMQWGGLEHALWDAIGKLAGQPVYRLLGGAKQSVRVYLTCVWPGNSDQSQVSYDEQAKMALRIQKAGFKGMKIRAWRPKPLEDAEACGVIRAAVGPDFAIMFDRTAHLPQSAGQKTWDYQTALAVARALEKHQATWLEEPFDRDDFLSPARLARDVDIPITGGEGYLGLDPFRECLMHASYDILQPEGAGAGGIFICRKVAAMADGFHVPCILHGTMGLRLAGWVQASAAIGAAWQELALITPPLLPEEQWSPGCKLLKGRKFFAFKDGEIVLPDLPGLGLDVDEDALDRYRAR